MAGTPISRAKIAFLGEKPLAEKCLSDLFERSCEVVAVCTREKEDGLWWGKNRIKDIAKNHGVPLLKRHEIKDLRAGILISVLYPFVIEAEIIKSARSAFNLHLAPLPEYKGCNTGSHALMKGASRFGVTFHEMTEVLDSGRLVEKKYFELTPQDTSRSLYDKANEIGWDLWMRNIDAILFGKVKLQDVKDDGSLPFDRHSLDNKQIPVGSSRIEAYNFARALDFEPFEAAYFMVGESKVHLRQRDFDPKTLRLNDPALELKLSEYLEERSQ